MISLDDVNAQDTMLGVSLARTNGNAFRSQSIAQEWNE